MLSMQKHQTSCETPRNRTKHLPAFRELARTLGANCRDRQICQAAQPHRSQDRHFRHSSRLKMDRMDVLKNIDLLRDERLDILEKFKEHQKELLYVLRNSAVVDVENLQRTVQVYCEVRTNIATMVNNLDILEEDLVLKLKV